MEINSKVMSGADGIIGIQEPALTTEIAAQRLGISTRTMRRLVAERRIRYWRIGRLVRLQSGDVERYLARCVVEPVE